MAWPARQPGANPLRRGRCSLRRDASRGLADASQNRLSQSWQRNRHQRLAMLTGWGIQALLLQEQTFHGPASDNMGIDDLVYVGKGNPAIPYRFGIDHDIRSVLALIEASGMIGPHLAFQATFGKFLFERLLEFGLAGRVAASTRMPGRT